LPIGNVFRVCRHDEAIIGGAASPAVQLRSRRWCRRWKVGRVLLLDCRANLLNRAARIEQRHRIPADIEANRATNAVWLPFRDRSVRRSRLHEAVVISVMAHPLAPAIARYVLQHFWMASGKFVHLLHDRHRTRRGERHRRQRWQRAGMSLDRGDPVRSTCSGCLRVLMLARYGDRRGR